MNFLKKYQKEFAEYAKLDHDLLMTIRFGHS
jgi:hypothetical protein